MDRKCVSHRAAPRRACQDALVGLEDALLQRIVAMDRKFAERGAQSDHDSRTYLAWSNSLSGHVFLPCAHALLLGSAVQSAMIERASQPSWR